MQSLGHFGKFGGIFVSELLMPALEELFEPRKERIHILRPGDLISLDYKSKEYQRLLEEGFVPSG